MSSVPSATRGRPANFDRLAKIYRAIEFLAFGRDLEWARFHFLPELRDCHSILVIGEGDGRCLAQLLKIAPAAQVQCVDASAAMIARARARVRQEDKDRVSFICADLLTFEPNERQYDAVISLFVLDCFTTEQVTALIARFRPHLSTETRWLFADFVVPASGWRRMRARWWLAILYHFFRWQTGLAVDRLPDSEKAFVEAGFVMRARQELQHGMIVSAVYGR